MSQLKRRIVNSAIKLVVKQLRQDYIYLSVERTVRSRTTSNFIEEATTRTTTEQSHDEIISHLTSHYTTDTSNLTDRDNVFHISS